MPADLPAHVDGFVATRVAAHHGARCGVPARDVATEVRGPVEQMLVVVLPGFAGTGRPHRELPVGGAVLGFFDYLVAERGLRSAQPTRPPRGRLATSARDWAAGLLVGIPRVHGGCPSPTHLIAAMSHERATG